MNDDVIRALRTGKSRQAPPRAAAMTEALRGLGYSPSTALADIIDNSISAQATKVDLQFHWAESDSHIAILDNGRGMTGPQLDLAMRLGERSPLDERETGDLGRFGLGLKTASFSQCRSLTVASIADGNLGCLRWDLDVLASSCDDGWHLLEGPAEGSEHLLAPLLEAGEGTIILWEKLDRIVTPGFALQDFLDLMDTIQRHLAMVFHRFLSGHPRRLELSINSREIAPWDPFLSHHPATWSSPLVRLTGGVEAQGYVLPHKDRLSPQEMATAGGSSGWTAQQGFYVYRNERLLLAGSWLGLGQGLSWTKEEAHRLARLRLDITNAADAEWKIDIRKSTARPPVTLRPCLRSLAEDIRARARKVFAHRGQVVRVGKSEPFLPAWQAQKYSGGMRYRIDERHPAVRAVLENSGPAADGIRAMLRVIEETVPVQRIWLDTTEGRETPRTNFSGDPPEEILSVLRVLYRNMTSKKDMSPAAAKKLLSNTEPFHNYPDLIAMLPDTPDAEA